MELTKNQKLWIEALRSGKYKQAVGVLESTSGGFCCLGVACKVAEEHGVEVIYDEYKGIKTVAGASLTSQSSVKKWLGIGDGHGFPTTNSNLLPLAVLNDGGTTFEEIADIIEANPESYFYETNN